MLGQECTISAYQRVQIGQQCVIADRVMFIDFDHNVTDTEQPIRRQGIYKRDVVVGSNVWIGYGAQILRGVTVGDNAIIGAERRRHPRHPGQRRRRRARRPGSSGCARRRNACSWPDPVEPEGYGPSGPR